MAELFDAREDDGVKPYFERDGITLYHGDCREILPLLPKVDLILSDPPYGVSYVTAWRLRSDKMRKPIANDADLSVVAEAWPMAMDLLENNRHWYAFASPRMIPEAERVFGKGKHLLAWDKGDRGTVGDLECGFGEAWEAIFYGMKGRRPLNGSRPRTVIRYDWSSTMDPVHPTVKPVPLLYKLIEWSTNPGETVLDMFAGSGTTGAAAYQLGRKAILCEMDESYCHTARKRLEREMAQGRLFREPEPVAVQKPLFEDEP